MLAALLAMLSGCGGEKAARAPADAGTDAAGDAGWTPPPPCPPAGDPVTRPFAGPRAFGIARSLPDDAGSAVRADVLATSFAAGVTSIRADILWDHFEPERGVRDFSGSDRIVDEAALAGLETLGLLCYGTPWASASGEADHPPDDPADFAAFAGAMAARYSSRVPYWEVWNEQNVGFRFWPPDADPDAYAALLVASADAIRTAHPDALVVYGGLFGPPIVLGDVTVVMGAAEFLSRTLPAAAGAFDVLAYHPYRYPFTAPEHASPEQERLEDTIEGVRAALGDAGLDVPIWITEIGWHTSPGATITGASEEDQARWLVRGHVIALGAGVERVHWFTARDEAGWEGDQEAAFGWIREDGTPKPAYDAHRTLVDQIGQATSVTDLRPRLCTAGEHLYRFEGPDVRVTVGWIPEGTADVALPAASDSAEIVRLSGEREAALPEGGAYALSLSEDPSFLVE